MSAEDTRKVVEHHVAALLAGDVGEIMADYADDAALITNMGGITAGADAIRTAFSGPIDLSGFTLDLMEVEGECAFATWHSDAIRFGTDTFVVRDGLIVLQTAAIIPA